VLGAIGVFVIEKKFMEASAFASPGAVLFSMSSVARIETEALGACGRDRRSSLL
jgi:hypothetical protein